MSHDRIIATYRVDCEPGRIEARAQAIALEQSVELPLAAVRDERVRREVVGAVTAIRPAGAAHFDVDIALAPETVGADAGQLMNMLFGNTSLQRDVDLVDASFPADFAQRFGGPRFGIPGIRELVGARGRPLSCAALKPQGLPAAELAALAGTFARAGIDVVKDDHGLADQRAAPLAQRIEACQRAIEEANAATGHRTHYAPSLTGSLDDLRRGVELAHRAGARMALIAPMLSGVSTLHLLARESGLVLLAHPALAGAPRIAPPLLLGKLFRLFGADATIFPHTGGRFGYTLGECARIADAARLPWHDLSACLPVPAGGMTVERVPGLRELYGDDVMFLIGSSLLVADDLEARCRAFAAAVRDERSNVPNT